MLVLHTAIAHHHLATNIKTNDYPLIRPIHLHIYRFIPTLPDTLFYNIPSTYHLDQPHRCVVECLSSTSAGTESRGAILDAIGKIAQDVRKRSRRSPTTVRSARARTTDGNQLGGAPLDAVCVSEERLRWIPHGVLFLGLYGMPRMKRQGRV